MKISFLGILLLVMLLPAKTTAQLPHFNRLSIGQGLSNNLIKCVVKDNRGVLWVGTISGLNRYDGYQFKVFRHEARDTGSLSDDFILRIFQGPENKIWVETHLGFNIYDPLTEKFERNSSRYLQQIGLPAVQLTHMFNDGQGRFWFLMDGTSLFEYDARAGKASLRYRVPPGGSALTYAAGDPANGVWLVHANGLIERLDGNSGKIGLHTEALSNLRKNEVSNYALYPDRQGELWLYVAAGSSGVFHLVPSTGMIEKIDRNSTLPALNNNIIIGIVQDNDNRIWICTDHGGINVLDKGSRKVSYLLNDPDDDMSLGENSISTTYQDREGFIWIGTYKHGISYYNAAQNRFPVYHTVPGKKEGLQFNDVNDFAEDALGNLWVGTNGGGLMYFDRQHNSFTRYQHDAGNAKSLSSDVIVSLYVDRQQKLWIGTYFGGLDCFDGTSFTHYRHNPADPGSLADDRVFELLEDAQHNFWVGTLSGGLNRLDRSTGIFYHYPAYQANSVHATYISELMQDDAGDLWVGSSNGIDVLDRKTGKFTYYSNFNNDPNGISNNSILSLFQDSRGLVWVGTTDGLNVFDKTNNRFKSFRIPDGLPGNTILSIVEDRSHRLWVSTYNGISCITIQQPQGNAASLRINCKNYDDKDGLQGMVFNENAGLCTRDGAVVFGGANGFNIFDPGTIQPDKTIPNVVLTDLQVFNKSIGIGEKTNDHVILDRSISETKEIWLKNSENVLSLQFAALDFLNTDKIKYAYKLEGFDKDWVYNSGKDRRANYTNLDPGTYTLLVKAANSDDAWNEHALALRISVLPPFWQTPLAFLLYALFFGGILWLTRSLTLQKARMRFAVEKQQQEAARLHELDLLKIRFFTNVSHEFRTPLSLILSPLDGIISRSSDPAQRKQFQLIHRNARRLLNLVNQLLDFRKMEVAELKLHISQDDIVTFSRDISNSFSDIAEKKSISLSFFSTADRLVMAFDRDKLERILFNLLSNAFKFTGDNGQVAVMLQMEIEDNRQLIVIKVIDNGIGIPQEKQKLIFERFFQDEVPGSIVNQGSGIGLSISREFVRLHNGQLTVTSEPGKGSCFTVKLPVTELPLLSSISPAPDPETENTTVMPVEEKQTGVKKARLLLVEDNEDFLFYLKDNLRQHFSIVEAVNGKQGWQRALAEQPDLVVADISMPEMSGTELCRKMKQDSRTAHIPVILLTAFAGEEQQLKGFETGAADYMTKPFNAEILLSRIRNLLDGQSRLRKTFEKHIAVRPEDLSLVPPDEQFMLRVKDNVEKNLSDPDFSVEDLSRALFMSRVTLYKKLLSVTGKTPVTFIRSFRLQRAAQLLEKSQLTVAEVAYEVGFNNPKAFSKYFKIEFGTIPSAYCQDKKKHL